MKKVLMISLSVAAVLSMTVMCGGPKHTAEECAPIVEEMLTNLTAGQKAEDTANIATMKATLVPVLQKECMSGKFDLTCLKSAKSIPAIQACKK
ncbi:TIGR04454 family lipoprotein [Leptospira gomenensis]|uniref:TIGR04454 family lipoprotein n=1 Tax=Leptospira gomenensis TaxID=2484974 RepID=A0A5F1YQ39_9LEPT|nr:TIGR04454 family lipoprotein [Leptospira gomenensis]TGK32571.1 TIGR04454 family lipoprotein [Leptospira gomenensis]TGK38301.1 TIGR04454 family lipoprotein [Leptospira gomenensis]TGK52115.1 TIGR04454 family lipoprotein [Leptospira gomenensis]TGK59836.1 TIGR04454 family lipoprotein [Leptospira gomenensis]